MIGGRELNTIFFSQTFRALLGWQIPQNPLRCEPHSKGKLPCKKAISHDFARLKVSTTLRDFPLGRFEAFPVTTRIYGIGNAGTSQRNPGISRKKVWFPWVSKDIPNFLAPPHPKISRPESLALGSNFFPDIRTNFGNSQPIQRPLPRGISRTIKMLRRVNLGTGSKFGTEASKRYGEGSEIAFLDFKEAGKRYRQRKTTAVANYYGFGRRSLFRIEGSFWKQPINSPFPGNSQLINTPSMNRSLTINRLKNKFNKLEGLAL